MWTLNGERISPAHTRISYDQRDELYTLTIKKSTPADSGTVEFNLAVPGSPSITSRATLEVRVVKMAYPGYARIFLKMRFSKIM